MFTWWFWGMLNEAHLSTYTMVSSFPDLYVKQNISQKKCNPNKPKVRVKKGCCHNITQTKKTFRFNLRMIPLNFEVWVTIVFNKSCPGKFMGQGVAKRDLGDKPFYWRSIHQSKTPWYLFIKLRDCGLFDNFRKAYFPKTVDFSNVIFNVFHDK